MSAIETFLREIDSRWELEQRDKIRLNIIGATSLRLQGQLTRGTKDSDVLQTDQLTGEVAAALLQLAGVGTAFHRKHRLYIEIVSPGIPFLPHAPLWNELALLNQSLSHFHVRVLDIVDVVVSKLKPFRPSDRTDIDEVIDADLVPHDRLVERFASAFDLFLHDARVQDLRGYVANLNTIERDSFGVPETPFEIPDWADR